MSYNVSFISLGCAKNQVNCEQMMALCAEAGYSIQAQPEGCDVVVVNTCGFLASDCGTVLLYDPVHQAIGAVHAGWRGCAAGIVEKTVAAMGAAYGSRPADLLAALGPCIGPCCFETDGDVPEAMQAALGANADAYITVKGPKFHVDLAGLNRQWLLRASLLPERIEVSGICTACRPDLFWSHRKMGDQRGVQVAVISLKEGL